MFTRSSCGIRSRRSKWRQSISSCSMITETRTLYCWSPGSTTVSRNRSNIAIRYRSNPPMCAGSLKEKTVKAVQAGEAGLDARHDPYRRATIGVKVLEGIGEFINKPEQDVQIQVAWMGSA